MDKKLCLRPLLNGKIYQNRIKEMQQKANY